MSDQPTPTSPWDDYKHTPLTKCIDTEYHDGERATAKKAWSELCTLRTRLAALERVMKAADIYFRKPGVSETTDLMNAIDAAKGTEC